MKRNDSLLSDILMGIKGVFAILYSKILLILFLPFKTKKNLILFECPGTKNMTGNPLYLYKYFQQRSNDFEYVWAVSSLPKEELDSTTFCKYRSFKHLYYSAISKFLICNATRSNEMPVRRSQIQIQTWHGGGCYKKVGAATKRTGFFAKILSNRKSRRYDYFISSSSFFTREVIRNQFSCDAKVLEIGMPRNDIFFYDNGFRDIMRAKLGITDNDFFVLYAPTWRDFGDIIERPDIPSLKHSFEHRFGKNVLVGYRGHYYSDFDSDGFDFDLSSLDDMQSLLCAADALITDYSSSIWDYSYLYRPTFLFTPDLDKYSKDRGFDIDIYDWGFPVCKNNDELNNSILNFSKLGFKKNILNHHESLCSYEEGNAREKVYSLITELYQS